MTSEQRKASFRALFRAATSGLEPYAWQTLVAIDGLPDVLTVPTGLGKTEVAWARRLRGPPPATHEVPDHVLPATRTRRGQHAAFALRWPVSTPCVQGR